MASPAGGEHTLNQIFQILVGGNTPAGGDGGGASNHYYASITHSGAPPIPPTNCPKGTDMKTTCVLMAALLMAWHVHALEGFYRLDIVATNGATGLGQINQEVSINDRGRIAFIGKQGTGGNNDYSSIWVADGNGAQPRNVNPTFSGSGRVFSYPQINGLNQIVASEFLGTGGNIEFSIRTWDANSGDWNGVQFNTGTGLHNGLTLPSLANDGAVSYVEPVLNQLKSWLRRWNGVSPVPPFVPRVETNSLASIFPPAPSFSPMIAVGGAIIMRDGESANNPIVLFNGDGSKTIIAASPIMTGQHLRSLKSFPKSPTPTNKSRICKNESQPRTTVP